jgi:hypothetical protein
MMLNDPQRDKILEGMKKDLYELAKKNNVYITLWWSQQTGVIPGATIIGSEEPKNITEFIAAYGEVRGLYLNYVNKYYQFSLQEGVDYLSTKVPWVEVRIEKAFDSKDHYDAKANNDTGTVLWFSRP